MSTDVAGASGLSDKWTFDAFISHAHDDKESIALPLAIELMQRGLAIWFDAFELTVGDEPRRKIDDGLRESAFGVVILSEAYFAKEWAQKELDGLVSRDDGKEKVILPVWHGVTRERVRDFTPMLADRLAVSSEHGITTIADELLRAMQREKGSATVRIQTAKPSASSVHAVNLDWLARSRTRIDNSRTDQGHFEESAEKVCILCADLAGAAAFKARHSSIDGFEKVYTHNRCVQEVVESPQFCGKSVKFIDGSVVAVFRGNDVAARGMRAAAAIVERIKRENGAPRNWHFPKAMSTRIGVDYGPVWMMKFGSQAIDDPLGRPVDTAMQLARLAGSGQILATSEAFESVLADPAFANRTSATYPLPGSRGAKSLIAVASREEAKPRIVLPGGTVDFPHDVKQLLDSAHEHWLAAQLAMEKRDTERADKELSESMGRYRAVLDIDALNFDANFFLAEHLALHVRNKKKERSLRLDEARMLLQIAASQRPEACFAWKLLGWVRFRQYRAGGSSDLTILNEAIEYADHALRIALSNKDTYGAAISRIFLIIYCYFRVTHKDVSREQQQADTQVAQRHSANARSTIDAGLGKWLESQFRVGEALIGLITGKYNERQAIEKLDEARKLDSENMLAAELVVELMNGVDPSASTNRE